MFGLSDSRSIGASLYGLNPAKIKQEQTQCFSFTIVIIAIGDNNYCNICNNGIPALSIIYLLAS